MATSKRLYRKTMKVKHTDEEPIYFQEYEPEALENIIDTQHKIITYMKKQGHKNIPNFNHNQ